jgi:hypothetical protein
MRRRSSCAAVAAMTSGPHISTTLATGFFPTIFAIRNRRNNSAAIEISKGKTAMISRILNVRASHSRVPRFGSVLLACLLLVMIALAVRAATPPNSFEVKVSEKELRLQHPDGSWDDWLAGDLGYQRMVQRNAPFVELTNTSTNPITEFRLTIGDNRFNFAPTDGSNLVTLGRTTPGYKLTAHLCDPTTETCATDSTGAELKKGDELIVKIENTATGGGLPADSPLRFKIKLGIDGDFVPQYQALFDSSVPDFRTVLFDMANGDVYGKTTTGSNTSDNAQASAVFGPNGDVVTQTFADSTENALYYNNFLRGSCCCATDSVLLFQPPPIVPEPSSFVLVIFGIAGWFLNSRPRRGRLSA